MRRRHQQGSLKKVGASWIAQGWEDGHRRKKTLGRVAEMSKSQAQNEPAAILLPINSKQVAPSEQWTFGDFVNEKFLPWKRRRWKTSTMTCNIDRLRHHLPCEFNGRPPSSFTRDELQDFLDRKAASGLSFSTVDHLRWDLKDIFGMAAADSYIQKNPAGLIFTPKSAARPERQWK